MSMDLIISGAGDVMIASNKPFPAEVSRVDIDPHSGRLVLNFYGQTQDMPLDAPVPDRMMAALLQAASILLVHFAEGKPQDGYDVPLVQVMGSAMR